MSEGKTYTRRLSLKQAQACENALTPRCRCRCGGALHGAKRGVADGYAADELPPEEFFEGLPEDDAHRITSETEREDRRRAAVLVVQARAVIKKYEHDRDRLLELGMSATAAKLEADIAEQKKRLEWLRGRVHRAK